MRQVIAIILCCVLLTGCNNKNSDDEYSLAKLQSLEEGVLFSFDLAGVDLNLKSYSGFIEVSNGPQEMYEGVLIRTKRVSLNVTDDDISSIFSGFENSTLPLNIYIILDMDGNLIRIFENTGNICTNTSPDKLPSFVEIGDFGELSPLVCLGGGIRYRSWKIESDGKNNIKVIITTKGGLVDEVVYILDATGNIIGFEAEMGIVAHPQSAPYTSRLRLYAK